MCERHEGHTSTILQCGSELEQKPLLERVRISRRDFGALIAGSTTGLALGMAGSLWCNNLVENPAESRLVENPPYDIGIHTVVLSPPGYERRRGTEAWETNVRDQMDRVTFTTAGAYNFSTTCIEDHTKPDVNGCFSEGALENIAKKRHQELGEKSIVLIAIDGADTQEKRYGGLAHYNGLWATLYVGGNVPAHEALHLCGPTLGQGLGHELRMPNDRWGDQGERLQALGFDTIQQMLAIGYDLEKVPGDPSSVNQYASPVSVMGRSELYKDDGFDSRPVVSAPQLAFLDPRRKVAVFEGHSETVRYSLSQELGGQLGVEINLPSDHALKKILPNIEQLFFGPVCDELLDEHGNKIRYPIKKIGVFAKWEGGRGTALLETAPFDTIDYPGEFSVIRKERQSVVYADEQLDLLVTAGYNQKDGVYIDLQKLSSSAGRSIFEAERRRVDERNQQIMNMNK